MINKWVFEKCIVVEVEYCYDLHEFDVYDIDECYLGTITPDSIETMQSMINDLNNSIDPITYMWEDGKGNICTLDGWK